MTPHTNLPDDHTALPQATADGIGTMRLEIDLDADRNIATDLICRRCGHNLRGLNIDGRCGECGTSVGYSAHGDLLRYSDPDWVDRIAQGSLWLIVSTLIMIVGIFAITMVVALTGSRLPEFALGLTVGLIWLAGIWMVTAPDTGESRDKPVNLANALRVITLVTVTGDIANMATESGIPGVALAAIVWVGITSLMELAASIMLLIHYRRLADRIPEPRLARQSRFVMWGFIVCLSILAISGGIGIAAALTGGGMGTPTGVIGALTVAACGGIGMLVFSIWWIVLLFWYRRAFIRATTIARATWADFASRSTPHPSQLGG